MTVPASSITVRLSVPAYPAAGQEQVLEHRIRLQRHVRNEFWGIVRDGLERAGTDLTWPRPTVLAPVVEDRLYGLTAAEDRTDRDSVGHVVSTEIDRLRRLPHRVSWEDLQPGTDLDRLSVPGRPFVVEGDLLCLPGLDVETGAYAPPQPFRAAVLQPGIDRLVKRQVRLVEDLEAWDRDRGEVKEAVAQQYLRHARQCGRRYGHALPVPEAVPGVRATRAVLHRRFDRTGERRWMCELSFTLSSEAVRRHFPEATVEAPVGIDPGLQHPLTWGSAGRGCSLHHALIDLAGFPGNEDGGARASRRACWERHVTGYDRVWAATLQHRTIRIEDTRWRTLAGENPDFVARAHDNFLWCWLDHVIALAPLTGSVIEFVPSKGTSCTCSECGHRNPRRQQTTFVCTGSGACGYAAPVDINACLNIAQAMRPRRPARQDSTAAD